MRSRECRTAIFLFTWLVSGAAVLIAPLVMFTVSRQQNSAHDYYQSLYQRQQELYVNQQSDGSSASSAASGNSVSSSANTNNASSSSYKRASSGGFDGTDDYWMDDWSRRKKANEQNDNCSYFWGCAYKNHEDLSYDDVPNWWVVGPKKGTANAGLQVFLTIVYVGFMVCGVIVLTRGSYVAIYRPASLKTLFPLLSVSIIASMLTIILVGFVPGMIAFEGVSLEENGWYGQIGILLFLTCFFWIIFAVGFSLVLYNETNRATRLCFDRVDLNDSIDNYKLHDDNDDGIVQKATIHSGKPGAKAASTLETRQQPSRLHVPIKNPLGSLFAKKKQTLIPDTDFS